jgi:hypothetical protein
MKLSISFLSIRFDYSERVLKWFEALHPSTFLYYSTFYTFSFYQKGIWVRNKKRMIIQERWQEE